MARASNGKIDFIMMLATHNAFRRDLDRLRLAAVTGQHRAPSAKIGWAIFKNQLRIHHSVEDTDLWPRVRSSPAARPENLDLMAAMEAEHARVDPLLAAVDNNSRTADDDVAAHMKELAAGLCAHLDHEEQRALPVIQSVLTPQEWRGFTNQMRRRQGVKGAATYVPWVLDGLTVAERNRFLGALPAPIRLINRLFWEPRYRRRNNWRY